MTDKMNLPNRTAKARAAARFAKVTELDSSGRAKVVQVPGSEGKTYTVTLARWDNLDIIYATCKNGDDCLGNSGLTVCYHTMAAIIKAAEGKGEVSFTSSPEDAERLVNLKKGKLVCISSEQASTGKIWAVLVYNGEMRPSTRRSKAMPGDKAMPVSKKSGSRMFK